MMTVLLVLFAEVLPKSYAINHADQFALRIAFPIRILVWLFLPVTAAIKLIVGLFLAKTKRHLTAKMSYVVLLDYTQKMLMMTKKKKQGLCYLLSLILVILQ